MPPTSAPPLTLDPLCSMTLEPPYLVSGPYFGPTFAGSPGASSSAISALPGQPTAAIFSPMAALAQSISHVSTNVTHIMTTKLQAIEDYVTWRAQFESFLVSQGLLGMIDGSIQVLMVRMLHVLQFMRPEGEGVVAAEDSRMSSRTVSSHMGPNRMALSRSIISRLLRQVPAHIQGVVLLPLHQTPPGDANQALWYPDSGASAHMTSSEGQNLGSGASTSYE
ncbi:unnamed protein product [Cuscuta europaea]|uniref:Uncharacterized protein n=1 Tax=Cuscuta europaea TaxID=41803 RepID=A0A9P0VRR8_CUSEU|nr:unnamed protein product [Cuscuta europaea]